MVDVRGDVLRQPHCTTPAAVAKTYKGYRRENAVYKLIENLLEEQKENKQNFNKEMIISKNKNKEKR